MIYADEEDYNNDDNDDAWEHANSDVGDRLCMARSCEQLLGEVVLPEKYHHIFLRHEAEDSDNHDHQSYQASKMSPAIKRLFL